MEYDVDLLIVGAGPAGLYAAYYAGFRALSVVIVDSLTEPGGQLAALYPEKMIYDVGGIPAILGRELAADLFRQAQTYDPTFLLGHGADQLTTLDDGTLRVMTDTGHSIHAKAILVTAGIGIFTPRPFPPARSTRASASGTSSRIRARCATSGCSWSAAATARSTTR